MPFSRLTFPALALGLLTLAGCASSEPNRPPVNPDKEKVSTIPWNKPASWEGQGSLGGMAGGLGGGR